MHKARAGARSSWLYIHRDSCVCSRLYLRANGLTIVPLPSSSPGRCHYRRLSCWRASAAASACSRSIFHKHNTLWDSRFHIMESCDICISSAETPRTEDKNPRALSAEWTRIHRRHVQNVLNVPKVFSSFLLSFWSFAHKFLIPIKI